MRPPPARRRHHQSRAHVRAGLHATAAGAAAKKHNHLVLGIEKVGLVSKLGIEKIGSVSNVGIEKSDGYRASVSKNWMGIENIGSVSSIGIEKSDRYRA